MSGDDDVSPGDDDDAGDTLVWVEAQQSELIPTVLTVRFDTDEFEAIHGYVTYGRGESLDASAPAWRADDGAWEVMLLGLKPSVEYSYQPVLVGEDGLAHGDRASFTTGALSTLLTSPQTELFDSQRDTEGFLVTNIVEDPGASVILDEDGDVVWWYVAEDGKGAGCVLSADRRWMLFLSSVDGTRTMHRLRLDGSILEEVPSEGLDEQHHDFMQLPDEHLLLLENDRRVIGGLEFIADKVVDVSPDGTDISEWSLWDHETYDPEVYGEEGGEWSHGNALAYDEEDDAFVIGFLLLHAIYKIDRRTGQVMWRLGGDHSDFTFVGDTAGSFRHQHAFELVEDGIVVFDNGVPEDASSRAVEYRLDLDAWTAEMVWEYRPDPALYAVALGDVAKLSNGNRLVDFSPLGQIDEVNADGDLVWRLNLPFGAYFGYMQWFDNLDYSPASSL